MQTVIRTQSFDNANRQVAQQRELTPTGKWMRENKGGIIVVKDRRAVNK